MDDTPFTVIVAPRERFSMALVSLRSLRASLSSPVPLLYVDGGSPEPLARKLNEEVSSLGGQIIRRDFIISQHEAYNLALPFVKTPYAIMVDNDVIFTPGWADQLVRTAEETGAWAVAPLYLEEDTFGTRIHMAGGTCRVVQKKGGLVFDEPHFLGSRPYHEIESLPELWEIDLLEYHAFLVRMDKIALIGPFDEGFSSAKDHVDFSLLLKAAGGGIWMDRRSRVIYRIASFFEWMDYRFYLTRWSDVWNKASFEHFSQKWGVHAPLHPWLTSHRREMFSHWIYGWKGWISEGRLKKWANRFQRVIAPLESWLNARITAVTYEKHLERRKQELCGFTGVHPGMEAQVKAHAERLFSAPSPWPPVDDFRASLPVKSAINTTPAPVLV